MSISEVFLVVKIHQSLQNINDLCETGGVTQLVKRLTCVCVCVCFRSSSKLGRNMVCQLLFPTMFALSPAGSNGNKTLKYTTYTQHTNAVRSYRTWPFHSTFKNSKNHFCCHVTFFSEILFLKCWQTFIKTYEVNQMNHNWPVCVTVEGVCQRDGRSDQDWSG